MLKILTVIPYYFFPPTNGGSLRCFHLLKEMSKVHEMLLITVQPISDFSNPEFPENIKIFSLFDSKPYSSALNIFSKKIGDAFNYRLLTRKIKTSTNSFFLDTYPLLLKICETEKPSLIIYENLEGVGLFAKIVRRKFGIPQFYDAHNIDSELWYSIVDGQNGKDAALYAKSALSIESNLKNYVEGAFCCSCVDKNKLESLGNLSIPIWLTPNGVDLCKKKFQLIKQPNFSLVFCGNLDYFPNYEGVKWFVENIFPILKLQIPDISLTLIGTEENQKYSFLKTHGNIHFTGRLPDISEFYYAGSVAIAPLLTGSGTRLKILEAMCFGNPVVATPIATEGIDVTSEEHLFLADNPNEFAEAVILLLKDPRIFKQVRLNAYELIKANYGWQKIGQDLNFKILEYFNVIASN